MANNISKVYLLDTPLENDLIHTLYFENAASQQSYFLNRKKHEYLDVSYQRKDNIIRIPAGYDSLQDSNYVMYQNAAYSNKWYYAFVTKMEYINDGRTDVYIETDPLQTFMFDITMKASFVEREHTDNDIRGNNIVPESLETGDYICYSQELIQLSDMAYVLVLDPTAEGYSFKKAGNIINGYDIRVFYDHVSGSGDSTSGFAWLTAELGEWTADQKASIFDVYCVPWLVIKSDVAWNEAGWYEISNRDGITELEGYISVSFGSFGNYTPKNKKLYTYPYYYLEGSNLKGQTMIYKHEYFDIADNKVKFNLAGNIIGSGDAMLYPLNYAGDSKNYNAGLSHGGYIHTGWGVDGYNLFIAQNSNRMITDIGQSIVNGAIGGIYGGAAGVVRGAAISGFSAITSNLATINDAKHNIDINKGAISSGTLPISMHINGFRFRQMGVTEQYARIIDDYFSMYGYKTNRVKTPLKNHRKEFWFTKTVDANIDGTIPAEDIQKIKDAYNNGITFWRNAANIQNYNVDNSIV